MWQTLIPPPNHTLIQILLLLVLLGEEFDILFQLELAGLLPGFLFVLELLVILEHADPGVIQTSDLGQPWQGGRGRIALIAIVSVRGTRFQFSCGGVVLLVANARRAKQARRQHADAAANAQGQRPAPWEPLRAHTQHRWPVKWLAD